MRVVVAAATEKRFTPRWHGVDARGDARDLGEIEGAAHGSLPKVIQQSGIRGDVHMHTTASDGRSSIREMAERRWLAVSNTFYHRPSKGLAMTGLRDDNVALSTREVHEVDSEMEGRFAFLLASRSIFLPMVP